MRILVGVIASELPVYRRLEEEGLRKTWADTDDGDEDVEIVYYYGGARSTRVEGDRVFFPVPEGLENIGRKTVAFFDHILGGKQFDYLLRTNCSSYVSIANLKAFLSDKPSGNFWSAVVTGFGDREFASGAGYILTPDLVKLVADNRDKLDHGIPYDDVSLSFLLQDLGIRLVPGRRQDFQTVEQVAAIDASHYHFRCKSFDDSDRVTDCQIMRRVHEVMRAHKP